MDWRATLRRAQEEPVPVEAIEEALGGVWPGVEVTGATALTGGLGSVLHRIHLSGASPSTVVLRRLLEEFGDDADTVRREVAVHGALPSAGVAVPRVHWADPGGAVLGRPALVLDDVPGRLLLPDLADADGRRAFAGVVHQMARVSSSHLQALPLLPDLASHVALWGAARTSSVLVDGGRIQRAIDRSGRWFRPQEQLVHGDLHAGNVLWDGRVVTGVLDWPHAARGVSLMDEVYAWMDTALALGVDPAEELRSELGRQRPTPQPSGGEWDLWLACALRRALPSPAPWGEAYRAAGLAVTDEQVEERFVTLVEDHLGRD